MDLIVRLKSPSWVPKKLGDDGVSDLSISWSGIRSDFTFSS